MRDILEAKRRVAKMSNAEIKLFAERDPDIFRDIASGPRGRWIELPDGWSYVFIFELNETAALAAQEK